MERKWLYVALTSFFEQVWIYGFNTVSAWWHWVFILIFIFIEFTFLTKVCELLRTGTVYAIYAGIGTIGTALMDVFLFGGRLSAGKVGFIVIITIRVIGLNIADKLDEDRAKRGMA